MHVKFQAMINHSENVSTYFQAFDKTVKGRPYLGVIEIGEAKKTKSIKL